MRALILLSALTLALPLPAASQQALEQWTLAVELRIGCTDGVDCVLSEVGGIEVGGDGSIYIMQSREGTIRIFDRDGRPRGALGGRGSGPGEFRPISSMGWKADSLWVADWADYRVSLFGPTGEHARTFRFNGPPRPPSGRPVPPNALSHDGQVLGLPLTSGHESPGRVPLLIMSESGGVVDSVPGLEAGGAYLNIRDEVDSRRVHVQTRLPVQSHSLWGVSRSDSSIVIVHRPIARSADRGAFQVARIRPGADTMFFRQFRYRPQPLDIRNFDVEELVPGSGVLSQIMPQRAVRGFLEKHLTLPAFDAPISELVVGRDGTSWLRREALGRDSVTWLVLAPNGTLHAEFRAPAELRIHQAQRDQVWGTFVDDLDVPYVVRYRVVVR